MPPRPAAAAARAQAASATVPSRGRGGGGGVRWPIVAVAVALLALIVVGVVVLAGGGDDEPAATQEPNVVAPPPSRSAQDEPPRPRGETTVAVLNGTTVNGLAKRTAAKIEGAGFDVPADLVTDAVEQNRSATIVMFAEGARDEALEVAKVIGVGRDAVDVLDTSTRTLTQGRARVVVTVGADQSQQ
ncbi:MAG TPA: LytR C-terminal domain-containing protein [Solirubrobacteraceae bacterium]|nr:LytR C-terminal domain-containing protein [Solirubrobacteraceae bacterium]